jgi:hypothetical protein
MGDAVLGRGHRADAPGARNFRDVLWGMLLLAVFSPIFYFFLVVWRCAPCWMGQALAGGYRAQIDCLAP